MLLFGWKDTGKTSVAINLARNHGFKFVSEGRTVIDTKYKIVGKIQHLEEDNDFCVQDFMNEGKKSCSRLCEAIILLDRRKISVVAPRSLAIPLQRLAETRLVTISLVRKITTDTASPTDNKINKITSIFAP